MQHHLVAAMVGRVGHFGGEREIWQHRNCDGKIQGEDGVGGGAVVADVVNDDGELGAFAEVVRRKFSERRGVSGPRRLRGAEFRLGMGICGRLGFFRAAGDGERDARHRECEMCGARFCAEQLRRFL
jgi:hypothetical protein